MSTKIQPPKRPNIRIGVRPDPTGFISWIKLTVNQWEAMQEIAIVGWPSTRWGERAMDKLIYYGLVNAEKETVADLTDLGVRAMDRRFGGQAAKDSWRNDWRQHGSGPIPAENADAGKTGAKPRPPRGSKDKRRGGG